MVYSNDFQGNVIIILMSDIGYWRLVPCFVFKDSFFVLILNS